VVELGEALGRERAPVRALQVLEHPLLAREIDESDAVLVLVALELRDDAQALVHELDERAVEIRELAAHLQHVRIVGHSSS
jgi:hypothetical protein